MFPSHYCALKPISRPTGGCVLKPAYFFGFLTWRNSRPTGGCVLKQRIGAAYEGNAAAAPQAAVC